MMLSVLNHTNKGFFDGLVGEGGGVTKAGNSWQELVKQFDYYLSTSNQLACEGNHHFRLLSSALPG